MGQFNRRSFVGMLLAPLAMPFAVGHRPAKIIPTSDGFILDRPRSMRPDVSAWSVTLLRETDRMITDVTLESIDRKLAMNIKEQYSAKCNA